MLVYKDAGSDDNGHSDKDVELKSADDMESGEDEDSDAQTSEEEIKEIPLGKRRIVDSDSEADDLDDSVSSSQDEDKIMKDDDDSDEADSYHGD